MVVVRADMVGVGRESRVEAAVDGGEGLEIQVCVGRWRGEGAIEGGGLEGLELRAEGEGREGGAGGDLGGGVGRGGDLFIFTCGLVVCSFALGVSWSANAKSGRGTNMGTPTALVVTMDDEYLQA